MAVVISQVLHVSVIHHLLQETDILCILVPLVEEKPWLRQNHKNEREVWEGTKWVVVEKNDYSKVPKMEVFFLYAPIKGPSLDRHLQPFHGAHSALEVPDQRVQEVEPLEDEKVYERAAARLDSYFARHAAGTRATKHHKRRHQ